MSVRSTTNEPTFISSGTLLHVRPPNGAGWRLLVVRETQTRPQTKQTERKRMVHFHKFMQHKLSNSFSNADLTLTQQPATHLRPTCAPHSGAARVGGREKVDCAHSAPVRPSPRTRRTPSGVGRCTPLGGHSVGLAGREPRAASRNPRPSSNKCADNCISESDYCLLWCRNQHGLWGDWSSFTWTECSRLLRVS